MNTKGIIWETEGDKIDPEIADVILYRSPQISSFLDPLNKHFIVASKGLGKTLILKTKRFILEKKEKHKNNGSTSTAFVPSDTPYLDTPINFGTLDTSKRNFLRNHEMAMKIWEFSIQLSAITVFVARTKRELREDLIKLLPKFVAVHIKNHRELSPCSVLGLILQKSVSDINQIIDIHSADVCIGYHDIHMPICIFIDQIDQAFLGYEGTMWYSMQTGLMEAAWSCMRSNHHIRIYASLRIEAYKNHVSPNTQALTGAVINLEYSKSDLEKILGTLSEFYEDKKFLDFIGFVDFVNPLTNEKEKVLDYIYRHTTGTPRDLVCIVSRLNRTKKSQTHLDIANFRETVNMSSHEDIGVAKMTADRIFLNALEISERDRFFMLIHRNILYRDELMLICKEFDEMSNFSEDCSRDCCNCENSHPFCELYNIGLLGSVQEINGKRLQAFLKPHELKGNLQTSMNRNSQIYMLHPSITKYIRSVRDRQGLPFTMVKFITVFNTHAWTEANDKTLKLQKTIEDLKVKAKVHQKLNMMFTNVYKKDIHGDIEKFNKQVDSTIEHLVSDAKGKKGIEIKPIINKTKQEQKKIKSITEMLLEINESRLGNKIKDKTK